MCSWNEFLEPLLPHYRLGGGDTIHLQSDGVRLIAIQTNAGNSWGRGEERAFLKHPRNV